MKFECEIDMDNDAFADDPQQELTRIFKEIISDMEDFWHNNRTKAIYDINGNKVGAWTIKSLTTK